MDPIGVPSGTPQSVNNRWASPGYFAAMNIEVKHGRVFAETDRGAAVAMLSEKAATLLWPESPNPVGFTFLGQDGAPVRLVGIVADVRAVLEDTAPATAYYPYWRRPLPAVTLVVRTRRSGAALVPALRSLIRSADPQLPIPAIRTMTDVIDDAVMGRRFQALVVVAFAGAGLLLSCLGIYGVVSYTVARRCNEIGIRLALGVGHAIRGLLFELRPAEPLVIASVVVLFVVVGALACLVPARRAAATNLVSALRIE